MNTARLLAIRLLLALYGALALAVSGALAQALPEVDVVTAAARFQEKPAVLDVREPSEHATGVIQGALLIPLGQVEKHLADLAAYKAQALYVVCASGGRSAQAIKTLSKHGFTNLINIKGGMNAWRKAQLPMVAP